LQTTPGNAALGHHAQQRGADELYGLFDSSLSDTIARGVKMPFDNTLLFHSYELIWFLAKAHVASNSTSGLLYTYVHCCGPPSFARALLRNELRG
jgi:hypothetical protein